MSKLTFRDIVTKTLMPAAQILFVNPDLEKPENQLPLIIVALPLAKRKGDLKHLCSQKNQLALTELFKTSEKGKPFLPILEAGADLLFLPDKKTVSQISAAGKHFHQYGKKLTSEIRRLSKDNKGWPPKFSLDALMSPKLAARFGKDFKAIELDSDGSDQDSTSTF